MTNRLFNKGEELLTVIACACGSYYTFEQFRRIPRRGQWIIDLIEEDVDRRACPHCGLFLDVDPAGIAAYDPLPIDFEVIRFLQKWKRGQL